MIILILFIVDNDEYNPEGADIETDVDNDTLGTYIPNEGENELTHLLLELKI